MLRGLIVLLLLAFLAGCGTPKQPPPRSSNSPLPMLIAIKGQASLKRSVWNSYAPALFGTVLRAGDLLKVSGRATVVCADLQLKQLTDYTGGVPCPDTPSGSAYAGVPIPTQRGQSDEIPLVITPVSTDLLNNRPTIRWTSALNASGYVVRLKQGVDVVWEREVGAVTSLAYPREAPPLRPNTTYTIVVMVAGDKLRSSARVQDVGNAFSLLPDNEARSVKATVQRIAALSLDRTAEHLITASVYQEHYLYAEAIELLEGVADEPAVLRARGVLYASVGLSDLTEAAFHQALDHSTRLGDLEGQAIALRWLGEIAKKFGDQSVAREHLTTAKMIYEQLGDRSTVQEIDATLARLPTS